MREIEFRAKDFTGNWRYGSLLERKFFDFRDGVQDFVSNYYISTIENDWTTSSVALNKEYLIIPETIGQFTGLEDRNDKEIYEGDIVEMHYFFENHDPSTLGVFEDEDFIMGYLRYDELGLILIDKENNKYRVSEYVQEPCEELEVIGNIYDNPELLEVCDD